MHWMSLTVKLKPSLIIRHFRRNLYARLFIMSLGGLWYVVPLFLYCTLYYTCKSQKSDPIVFFFLVGSALFFFGWFIYLFFGVLFYVEGRTVCLKKQLTYIFTEICTKPICQATVLMKKWYFKVEWLSNCNSVCVLRHINQRPLCCSIL